MMRSLRHAFVALAILFPSLAFGQGAILQGGPWAPGRSPMYVGQGSAQPIVQDSGPAGGGPIGVGLAEQLLIARGTGTPPYVAQGTGPFGTNWCDYDAPTDNAAGYHFLCISANAGGGGLIAYGAGGTASQLPLQLNINGVVSSVFSIVPSSAPAHQFATGITSQGIVTYAQPSFADLTGQSGFAGPSFFFSGTQLNLNPAATSVLGGVLKSSASVGSFVNGLDASGNFTYGTPSTVATLLYVSNAAVNNIPIGNDSTGNGSPGSPYLTIQKALSVAVAGQTILCNSGLYAPASSTVFTLSQSIAINSVTPLGCHIRAATGQSKIFDITATGNSTIAFGALDLDGNGLTTQLVMAENSAATNTINFTGTLLRDYAQFGLNEDTAGKFNLNASGANCTGTVGYSCFHLLSHSAGALAWVNQLATVSQGLSTYSGGAVVDVDADVAGVTFSFTGSFNLAVTGSTSGSTNYRAIQVLDIANAVVGCGSITASTQCGTISMIDLNAAECRAVEISADTSNPIQSDNPMIYGIAFTADCAGGGHGGATIGFDGDPGLSGRNLSNHGRIFNNTFTSGPDVVNPTALEGGAFCGWVTDCQIYRNSTNGAAYAYLIKGCVNCYVFSNIATNLWKIAFDTKSSTGGGFINNTYYETANPPAINTCYLMEEAGNPSTGVVFKNNICAYLYTGSNLSRFVGESGTDSTGTFSTNDYFNAGSLSAGIPWVYAGSSYSLLSTWQGAVEPTAISVNPMLVSPSAGYVNLQGVSTLTGAGTANASPVLFDFVQSGWISPPSLGAYQYVGPSLSGVPALGGNNTWTGLNFFPVGSVSAPSIALGTDTNTGFYETTAGIWEFASAGADRIRLRASQLQVGSAVLFGWSSGGAPGTMDTILSRQAAASLHLGAGDAASPVAQVFGVQGVVAGTSNTAGADFVIAGSISTGTGVGGDIIFKTAPAGGSGTAQNALAEALRITTAGNLKFASSTTGAGTLTFTNSPCSGLTTERWVPIQITGQSGIWYLAACQ